VLFFKLTNNWFKIKYIKIKNIKLLFIDVFKVIKYTINKLFNMLIYECFQFIKNFILLELINWKFLVLLNKLLKIIAIKYSI